ncbi:MAG TPA: aldehyde dehydrogenase family protein, partial [Solirubrobacterales bacterium]|nr:aldehyde dehydrogenase family protein [Solirubrobacterales bacterium]
MMPAEAPATNLLIGGELVAGAGERLAVENPFTTAIVCADVAPQLEVAARGGAWEAFLNAGQVCTSAERFYVAEEVYDDYVDAFV